MSDDNLLTNQNPALRAPGQWEGWTVSQSVSPLALINQSRYLQLNLRLELSNDLINVTQQHTGGANERLQGGQGGQSEGDAEVTN